MIKISFKKVGLLLLAGALTLAFSAKAAAKAPKTKKTDTNATSERRLSHQTSDSLKILSVILKSEFAKKNQVFICKNPTFADSLVRSLCGPAQFKNAISDSAVLQEIKSQNDFTRYWQKVEVENGIPALKAQMNAEDVDKTLIPKAYAFDSSVVIYPGWIIIRKK